MNDKDAFGDRMKDLEGMEAGRRFMPQVPIMARLDGKGFSKFTKGLKRPFDERMSNLMMETTRYLVEETQANCGYTQSDEISLVFYSDSPESLVWFDGRIQKMTSILAAKCSVFFNKKLPEYLPEKEDKFPVFDCRVWTVPTLEEGANTLLWREMDATKNSISMAAQEYYSHKELMNKNSKEKQEMLFQKKINWNDYPRFFKRGSFIQKSVVKKKLAEMTEEELSILPEKHNARKNPNFEFERSIYQIIEMPPFVKVSNRVGVVFFGETPIPYAEKKDIK